MMKPSQLVGLIRLESAVALILIAVPIALRFADDRGSISAYHDMADPRWFFVPLTAASMMLITNGLVQPESHGYNASLGLLLLGVVMFDHDGMSAVPHFFSAVTFFVLAVAFAALMITHYISVWKGSPKPSKLVAITSAVGVALPLGLAALLLDPPVFWVESVGVWIIALHYIAHTVWDVRRASEQTEPTTVLHQLWPGFYRLAAFMLSPATRFWRWLNAARLAAAAELARTK